MIRAFWEWLFPPPEVVIDLAKMPPGIVAVERCGDQTCFCYPPDGEDICVYTSRSQHDEVVRAYKELLKGGIR